MMKASALCRLIVGLTFAGAGTALAADPIVVTVGAGLIFATVTVGLVASRV